MRRLELLTALALLALPAAAHAQGPDGGVTMNGGWAGERERTLLRIEADEPGDAVTLEGWVSARCGAGTFAGGSPVAPDGSIAAAGTSRSGGTVVTWRLTGALELHRGRGRLDATIRRGKRQCTVAGLPWGVANASSAHQVGPGPDPGTRWHGRVGDGSAALVVASPATRAELLVFSVDMRFCPNRPGDRFVGVMRNLPIEDRTDFDATRRRTVRRGGIVRRIRLIASGTFYWDGLYLSVAVREVARRARTGRRLWACDTLWVTGYADDVGL